MNKIYTKAEIFEQIKDGVAIVSFKKVNGDIRHMECTLAESAMPFEVIKRLAESENPSDKPKKAPNPNTLAVWDVKAAGWRSFRIDSVFNVEKSLDL